MRGVRRSRVTRNTKGLRIYYTIEHIEYVRLKSYCIADTFMI